MSSLGKLGDDLMKVPRLEAGGVNWVVYKDRFLWSVDARGLLEHVDGSEREPMCPVKPQMVPRKDDEGKDTRDFVQAAYTQEEKREIKEWKAELKEWKRGEAIVKQQIAATIPDSLFMKIRNKGTALEIWDALCGDFQNKSRMVAVDLRRRLQQERCAEKGDVREHFSKLRQMREDLAAMGHAPGDDELYAIILGSLPYSFEPFISALNATSSVLGNILSPDELMLAFTDEYDRRNIGKSSKKEENAAFSAEDGNERGKGRNFKRGNCYNCDKPGHRKDDCWEEGGGKEGQKPNWLKEKEKWRKEKGGGSGKEEEKPKAKNSATTAMAEEIVAWMVLCPSDSDPEDDDDDIVSNTVTLEDFLEVDEEPRKEWDTDPVSAENKVHEIRDQESEEENLDWWDEPVEGERKNIDERVDETGNQPISQPAEPEPEEVERTDDDLPAIEAESKLEPDEQLPLAQPEEQGECWGKAASSENAAASRGSGEGVDEAYEKARGPNWHGAKSAHAGVILHTPHPKILKKPAREYNSGTIWDPQGEGERETEGRSGSGLATLNSAELVSRLMVHENSLSDSQHLLRPDEIAEIKNLPYREGIGPLTHTLKPNDIAINATTPEIHEEPPQVSSDKSRGGGGTPCINAREHEGGATHLDRVKRDLRGLEGEGDICWVSGGEENYLPVLQDAGGVPQHRLVGYMPRVDEKSSLDQSKGAHNAMWGGRGRGRSGQDSRG
jgi:hypothetical protein